MSDYQISNMLPVWNRKDLKPPPLVTYGYTQSEVHDGLVLAKESIQRTINCLKNDSLLRSEEFVLERMVYRFNNCLRMHKIMRSLKQVKRCIRVYKDMNLVRVLNGFLENLPSDEELQEDTFYIPSQQMFQFIQSRILGCGLLLGKMSSCSMQAFIQAQQQLGFGFYIPNMLVFASLVSRIRVLALNSLQTLSSSFHRLSELSANIKPSPVQWLPDNQGLPDDMEEWLKQQGVLTSVSPECRDRLSVLDKLEDDNRMECSSPDDDEEEERYDLKSDHYDASNQGDLEYHNIHNECREIPDLGTPISREMLQAGETKSETKLAVEMNTCVAGTKSKKSKKTPGEKNRDDTEANLEGDLPVLIRRIQACETPSKLLRILKQANIKTLSAQRGVGGFVKLKRLLKDFADMGSEDLELSTLVTLRKATSLFVKKVHKRLHEKHHVDSTDLSKTKSKARSSPEKSSMLIINSNISKHFKNTVISEEYLSSLTSVLKVSDLKYCYKGQIYQLSGKELKKMKKLFTGNSESDTMSHTIKSKNFKIRKSLIQLFKNNLTSQMK